MKKIKIVYDFIFPDKTERSYAVELDGSTMSFLPPFHNPPAWTELENKKCVHCPLNKEDSPQCPVAYNLSGLVEFFKDKTSYAEAIVRVNTEERIYAKKLPLQQGIFSIFGLIMATSACPYMEFLRPMARFHLPFSTSEETIVRSVSMYLLRQYFVAKKGGIPDLNLENLETHYENIQKVNKGIIGRIRGIVENDADVNALVILHSFADLLTMAISKDLSKIEPLFNFKT